MYSSITNPDKNIGLAQIGPSVTTGTDENPAYAVLELDAQTMLPLNWEFYVLDIEKANLKGEAEWENMFDYVENYHMGYMSPDTLYTLAT